MANLEMTRGNDAVFTLTITDASGALIDLTGAALLFEAKWYADGVPLVTGALLPLADQVANKGQATLVLDELSTSSLGNWEHLLHWGVQMVLAGVTSQPLTGQILIHPRIAD